ncbi:hypothetical protein N339_01881, partial [Pterocles gutturalis]
VTTLVFKRADLNLFRDLLGRVSWDKALEGRGAQKSWSVFKAQLLRAQEQCIPRKRKVGKNARRPQWMKKELLDLLQQKNKIYREWKQEQVSWEVYKAAVQTARDQVRKAKAQTELNLSRDIKGNKKTFYQYTGDKRKTREDMGPLQKETGDLATTNMEKAEVFNDFLASVFTGKGSGSSAQVAESEGDNWEKEDPPTITEDQV